MGYNPRADWIDRPSPVPQVGLCVKKQPSQDVLHGDEAEEELGLARLVSSYTLPHQNSQPGERGRQTARSKVLADAQETRDAPLGRACIRLNKISHGGL